MHFQSGSLMRTRSATSSNIGISPRFLEIKLNCKEKMYKFQGLGGKFSTSLGSSSGNPEKAL